MSVWMQPPPPLEPPPVRSPRPVGVGFFWLLPGFIATVAATVTTVGTIAAVAQAVAEFLAKAAGPETDFGKAMLAVSDVAKIVKLPSIFSQGYLGLIEGGIPSGFEAAAARWYELLKSPIDAVGGPAAAAKIPEVARTLAWAEKSLASSLPAAIATQAAGELTQAYAAVSQIPAVGGQLAMMRQTLILNAMNFVRDQQQKYMLDWWNRRQPGDFPPNFNEDKVKKLAEAQVSAAVANMLASPAPPPVDAKTLADQASQDIGGHITQMQATAAKTAASNATTAASAVAIVGGVGVAGFAALGLIGKLSPKVAMIGAGASGAVMLASLLMRPKPPPQSAQVTTASDKGATMTFQQALAKR